MSGGGGDGRAYTSVEVFTPQTEVSCSLPSLPNIVVTDGANHSTYSFCIEYFSVYMHLVRRRKSIKVMNKPRASPEPVK